MSIIIVDSDILIDVSRGYETAATWIEIAENNSTLLISSITEMELLLGSRDKRYLNETIQFLKRFRVVSMNEQISNQASDLVRRYCLSHRLLIPDAIIAATALTLDEPLATINQRDFRFIEGIRLISYP